MSKSGCIPPSIVLLLVHLIVVVMARVGKRRWYFGDFVVVALQRAERCMKIDCVVGFVVVAAVVVERWALLALVFPLGVV